MASADKNSSPETARSFPFVSAALGVVALVGIIVAVTRFGSSPEVETAGLAPTTEPAAISPLHDATATPTSAANTVSLEPQPATPEPAPRQEGSPDPFLPPHANLAAPRKSTAPTRHYRPTNVVAPAHSSPASPPASAQHPGRPAQPERPEPASPPEYSDDSPVIPPWVPAPSDDTDETPPSTSEAAQPEETTPQEDTQSHPLLTPPSPTPVPDLPSQPVEPTPTPAPDTPHRGPTAEDGTGDVPADAALEDEAALELAESPQSAE